MPKDALGSLLLLFMLDTIKIENGPSCWQRFYVLNMCA